MLPEAQSAKDSVTFYCKPCKHKFTGKPDFEEAAPEETYHPFRYYKKCPRCTENTEQAFWERNLLKAWANSTGPKTEAGKAASAANLEGHPTPEEALRTRFNAMKHGLSAEVATYYPAKPGKYPHCENCELRETVCPEETACLKRMDLFFKHHVAFDTKDPSKLTAIRANNQAAIQALINDMILAISQDGGPRIIEPQWYYDKDGDFHFAKGIDAETKEWVTVTEIKAHPLLKLLIEFISKNKLTMEDAGMTPKVIEEQEALSGFLDTAKPGTTAGIEDFMRRTNESMSSMKEMIERSQKATDSDTVLLEHQGEEANG